MGFRRRSSTPSSEPVTESRLPRLYQEMALHLLNTLVAVVGVNLLLAAGFALRNRGPSAASNELAAPVCADPATLFGVDGAPCDNGRRTPYQLTWFDFRAYGDEADAAYASEVLDAFRDLGDLGFLYQPWAEFSEPPFRSRLVNVDVDAMGLPIRRTVDPSRPGATDTLFVVVLGGSTTFGYNVADEQTWPSWLSRRLNEQLGERTDLAVIVRNYGRGYYYPSQEVALLGDLLRSGTPADLVIFMDGVNLGPASDVPVLTDEFARRFRLVQSGADAGLDRLAWIPMVRLAIAIRRRVDNQATAIGRGGSLPHIAASTPSQSDFRASSALRAAVVAATQLPSSVPHRLASSRFAIGPCCPSSREMCRSR